MDRDGSIKQHSPITVPQLSPKRSSHNIAQTAQQIAENIFKSNNNNNTEANKFKCTITSERLAQLKKIVDDAVVDHKIFTIKGGWQHIRAALLKRGWIEKFETIPRKVGGTQNLDDLCMNLPSRQAWESQKAHTEKCERTIMSRLLQVHDCDFYWNMRKDQSDWQHRCSQQKLMNRFGRSLFTSKEGLCLLLQQLYWHIEPGIAQVNFPRCYVLGFPDHFNNFIEDFRLTACMGLLKWFVHKSDTEDEHAIKSPEGKIPFSSVQFAMNRLEEFVASKRHLDIDRDFPKVWDHEWEQFFTHYFRAVHHGDLFLDSKEWSMNVLHAASKVALQEAAKYWPQYQLDGMRNIWIMKPGNKCRGRGIHLVRNIEDVAKAVNMKLKYIVQKYIAVFSECYLRFSSQIFNLDNFHESLHLTNHAVQCKYTNVTQRDKALPDENMWDCDSFKAYLRQIGHGNKWDDVIFPGMRQSLIATMLACQETMDRRPNTYELYGADFILAEDFTPWLLEINSSPDLSPSTSVTARMCPQCIEDLIKVIVDKRRDPKADTGMFNLIYKQNLPRAPAYLGMSLSVRGKRIFRNRGKRSKTLVKDSDNLLGGISKKDFTSALKPPTTSAISSIPTVVQASYTPREFTHSIYNGPVIGDLMEELQTSYLKSCEDGIDFVPALKQQSSKVKKKGPVNKDRVSRGARPATKSGTNKNRSANRKSKGSGKPDATSGEPAANESDGKSRRYVTSAATSSILKGHNILSKLKVDNKEYSKNGGCFGEFCGNFAGRHLSAKAELLTVGVNFQNCQKTASK